MLLNSIENTNLDGKRVIIRVDFNVPLTDGLVVDNFRIKASLPTIKYCLNAGASVVLMSHMGRPNGKIVPSLSLDPVAFELEDLLNKEVMFSNDCISEDSIGLSQQLKQGEIHLLENLRFHKGESENDETFSWFLSRHADIYINDAFGTAHRAHASNVGITKYIDKIYSGLLLDKEIHYLYNNLNNLESPSVLLLGGSKISGKIDLLDHMLSKIDTILIGGAMAFTFLSSIGKNVGASMVNLNEINIANAIIDNAKKQNTKIVLPEDVVSSKNMSADATFNVLKLDELKDDESGFDIGPETVLNFSHILSSAKTIIWNGPLGVCEIPAFATGTESIAFTIRELTESGTLSIIGGGDTVAALNNSGINKGFSHISTGGGASLELLSGKKLPAFEALKIYA